MKKKIIALALSISMVATLFAGCGQQATKTEEPAPQEPVAEVTEPEPEVVEEEPAVDFSNLTVRVGAMSGPTAMGMVKLMSDSEEGNTTLNYEFAELATEASAFVAPLAKGELDIAAVPSNLSSVLYNNTEGAVQVIAINNLGVLYVVEKGDSISEIRDLAGKTVYATGQGAVPEYTIRALLTKNGVDPDFDLELKFCADTTEALSYIQADENAIAILPQPFVTAACAQVEGLRVAIDLNDAWAAADMGCDIVIGVVVARKAFIEENPEAVEAFLKEYEASVAYTATNVEDTAALIEKYGIVAKAPLAQKALPGCHLKFMSGNDMKSAMKGFLNVLLEQNAQAVGGKVPADDFYYGAN